MLERKLLVLLVVPRLSPSDDSALLRLGVLDAGHLLDLHLRTGNVVLAAREMLLQSFLHAATLGNACVVVLAPFCHDLVDNGLVVRELLDPLLIERYGLPCLGLILL